MHYCTWGSVRLPWTFWSSIAIPVILSSCCQQCILYFIRSIAWSFSSRISYIFPFKTERLGLGIELLRKRSVNAKLRKERIKLWKEKNLTHAFTSFTGTVLWHQQAVTYKVNRIYLMWLYLMPLINPTWTGGEGSFSLIVSTCPSKIFFLISLRKDLARHSNFCALY